MDNLLKKSVSPLLVEQYFDLLSLSYRRRNGLFKSYQHYFNDLNQWDIKISQYLNGLLLLPAETEHYIQERLLEAVLSKGDIFTIGLYAATAGHESHLYSILTLIQASENYDDVVQDIIHWAPKKSILWQILVRYPTYHIYASMIRRDVALTIDPDVVRAITLIKPSQLMQIVLSYIYQHHPDIYAELFKQSIESDDDYMQLMALASALTIQSASSLPLLNDNAIKQYLYQLTGSSIAGIAQQTAKLLIFNTNLSVNDYLQFIQQKITDKRLYIQVLGWTGNIHSLPELIKLLTVPKYARLSAAAITCITGSLPEKQGWVGENLLEKASVPEDENGFPLNDPDSGLSWPDQDAFMQWLSKHQAEFNLNDHYLAGQSVENTKNLLRVFIEESLPLTELAACRLMSLHPYFTIVRRFPAYKQPQFMVTDKLVKVSEPDVKA